MKQAVWVLAVAWLVSTIAWAISERNVDRSILMVRQSLILVDSLQARISCLEAAGVDCTEPLTVGGDKLPYGIQP